VQKLPALDSVLLDAHGLSRVLGLTRATIYRKVKNDGLPAIRLSRRAIRFNRDAVNRWLQKKQSEAKRS
jgi:excisionase family DNA binding protein